MTTLTHPSDVDVRPDVRAEAHSHRYRNLPPALARVLFLLLAVSVSGGGLVAVAWTLGGAAYVAPQTI